MLLELLALMNWCPQYLSANIVNMVVPLYTLHIDDKKWVFKP